MATNNIVAAILGKRADRIKWDSTWNLLAWLFDPTEGHGLAAGVLHELTLRVFLERLGTCTLRTEVNLGPGADGKDKWPDLALFFPSEDGPIRVVVMDDVDVRSPNSSRKLVNLLAYGQIAKLKYPDAAVKVVVVTNAIEKDQIAKVGVALQRLLGAENSPLPADIGWHLVSLQEIGMWTAKVLEGSPADSKTRLFLADFIEWAGAVSTEQRPNPSTDWQ